MEDIKKLEKKALEIRIDALNAMHKASLSYVGSCMSIVEILVALYYGNLSFRRPLIFDPKKPGSENQDYLILSKHHAAVVLYAILADLGFFDKSELSSIGGNSLLKNYPNSKVPGVSSTIIDDGQGLSVALGIALSLKMERKSNRVFTVLSDAELQKGQVWESINLARNNRLNNLIAFVDSPLIEAENAMQSANVSEVQDKFEAFGWQVVRVWDGHDFDELLNATEKAFKTVSKPVCIWCRTIAGKGVEFAERKAGYLKAPLSDGEYATIISKFKTLV